MGEPRSTTRPKRLGHFEVLPLIAEGGMGVLHLARQPELDRLVVLKRMRQEMATDPSMVARFEREARAAAAVQHQNVVAVYDCFRHRGDHYIAQEFVDGVDLAELLGRVRKIAPDVAARIALGVALGLEEVHSRGIVHRDLKPSNVLIGYGGEIKIADFGIAVERSGPGLTQPGTMLGSVPYMSPEQMMGEHVDYRSDVFTFGILLYEMLAGAPPFRESDEGSEDTLLERIQRGRFVPTRRLGAETPRWMERLVRRCLRPKAAHRPQSMTDVRRAFERRVRATAPADARRHVAAWLGEHGVRKESGTATALRPVAASTARSRVSPRVVGTAAAVIALSVGLGTIGVLSSRRDPSPAAPREERAVGSSDSMARSPVPVASAPRGGSIGIDAAPRKISSTEVLPWLSTDPGDGPATSAARVDPEEPPSTEDDSRETDVSMTSVAGVPVSADSGSGPAVLAVPEIEPAEIRLVATPWARVTIDDRPGFDTPRAAPLKLAPGRHVVVFEHPTYGRFETVLDLAPGENRVVRHAFDEENAS
jgi:serine/threonine-protein kinase